MGPIMLAVVGVGLIVAGIFVTDPAQGYPPGTPAGPALHTTLHGAIHFFIGGIAFFGGLPAACFVFARRFAVLKVRDEQAVRPWDKEPVPTT